MSEQQTALHQRLGLIDIILFGLGAIVGAGIYAIIGEAAAFAGNLLWVSFLVSALVAFLTGLCYAEFVSRFPDAGGSFEYVKRGLGPRTALLLSIIMFFTGVVAPAAIAISFADYLSRLVDLPRWISVVGIILLMAGVNATNIQNSSWFNSLATVVTLLGLAAVVGFSLPGWGTRDVLAFEEASWTGLLSGSALIFFSYVGFEDLVKFAEETKNARKVMPRGIIFSAGAVTLIYVLIAISAISVMDADTLARSDGPMAAVMRKVAGEGWAVALVVVALFATSKTILSNLLGSSRLLFDVARDNDIRLLKPFERVDSSSGTPRLALLLVAVVTVLFGLIGNLKIVTTISNIFVFLLFLIVNVSLVRYRLLHRGEERPAFKMPLNVGGVSLLSYLAIISLLVLFGFNLCNLF